MPTKAFEQPRDCRFALRLLAYYLAPARLFQTDRFFDQVTGDLFDVAADIADLGELGRFDLDEWGVDQRGQPPG